MLRCNEVTRLAASGEIDGAGPARRLQFRLHLLMCRHCRNYVRQMRLLGNAARRLWATGAADPTETARIEREVLRALEAGGESNPPPIAGGELNPREPRDD